MTSPALPKRLILALDGVSYRDLRALQQGTVCWDLKGRPFHGRAFSEGYFPVSRMISTFPSTSDVAWTEMFGDRPLPGYQRTYFSRAANREVFDNGISSTMEYEKQMTWQVPGGFERAMGYVFPMRAFKRELREMVSNFLRTDSSCENYYAYLRSTDDAQHLSGDILRMLCTVDQTLQRLQAQYKARERRDLEILILSDHGHNHAGAGRRVAIRSLLKKAGYHVGQSLRGPRDAVLPSAGIETWVEIHNLPAETERLVELLWHLPGVDVLTARDQGHADRFIVVNSKGERAHIEWSPANDSFRYSMETGDPIAYAPVVADLRREKLMDADGFATADAWMAATIAHRYPLALERIVRGLTRVTLNPATILMSLKNGYVQAGWFVKKGSEMVTFGGTHGALDDLNSDGVLLSNFAPTKDTSTTRVASLYDGFPGLRDFRSRETGAEWVSGKQQALAPCERPSVAGDAEPPSQNDVFLRVWTPVFAGVALQVPLEITVAKARPFLPAVVRRSDPLPRDGSARNLTLRAPLPFSRNPCERTYALPDSLVLQPDTDYRISGRLRRDQKCERLFRFAFRTDSQGLPVAY